jgi:hypothetical protein
MAPMSCAAAVTLQRLKLRETGFAPLPLEGKKCFLEKWAEKNETNPEEIKLWAKLYPDWLGTGVLTRTMPALDIDIKHPDAATAVEEMARQRFGERGHFLVRFGNAPKRAVPFRTDIPFPKIATSLIASDGATDQKIEFLGAGQQLACFGIHPDTRKPYSWHGGEPGQIKLEDLPSINEAEARALVEDAVRLVAEFGYKELQARRKAGSNDRTAGNGSDPDAWADLLANIHAGRGLHDSLRDLAAKLVAAGMGAGASVNLLRAALQNSSAPRDARWKERFDAIPSLIASAREKFAGPADPPHPVVPVDLWASFDPPELPSGLLPDAIENFARTETTMMGADVAGLAMAALAVCAAAIPDSVKLQVKRHSESWTESARLWVALIGDPSTKKSPILRQAVWPLARIDARLHQKYLTEKSYYESLTAEEKKGKPPPEQRRVRIEDTTIEAAQEVLKASPEGVLCLQDELSGWFGSMDKYSGPRGAAKDRGFWLQSFNGGEYVVNRIGRGAVIIPNLSVSMLGGIQPEPVRKLAADAVDDGLLQRVCPIMLRASTMGRDEPAGQSYYGDLIDALHLMKIPKSVLRFDDGALAIRHTLERKHLDLMRCEAVNRKLSAHIGKYDGLFARLCVVWHCIENVRNDLPPIVTENTSRRVAAFLHEFLLPHAVAFNVTVLGVSDDHDRLTAVAGYILAHRLDTITNRDVQRGDRTMRNLLKKDIEKIFDQLDALGWINRIPGGRPADPPRWGINPECHRLFQARAEKEASRRLSTREAIAQVARRV